jgi:hypothetical protein
MTSSDSAEWLRLDRDLPTTAEDITVLRRLRYGPKLGFDEYLRALAALDPPPAGVLRARRGPSGAPFDLLAEPTGDA